MLFKMPAMEHMHFTTPAHSESEHSSVEAYLFIHWKHGLSHWMHSSEPQHSQRPQWMRFFVEMGAWWRGTTISSSLKGTWQTTENLSNVTWFTTWASSHFCHSPSFLSEGFCGLDAVRLVRMKKSTFRKTQWFRVKSFSLSECSVSQPEGQH